MFFLIMLFVINVANLTIATETTKHDNMKVKPLASSASDNTSSLSTTKDDTMVSKPATRINITPELTKATKNQNDQNGDSFVNDYEALEQLFEKPNEPNQGMGHKLTNKELIDNIFKMILKNKHVDVDCDSHHCMPGIYRQKNKKRIQKINDGFRQNFDFNPRDENIHFKNQYGDFNKGMYPMKLPFNTLAVQTPENGVLGRFHFRFVPIEENMKHNYGRV